MVGQVRMKGTRKGYPYVRRAVLLFRRVLRSIDPALTLRYY